MEQGLFSTDFIVFILCAVVASIIDIRTYRIPDIITGSCFVLLLGLHLISSRDLLLNAVLTALCSLLFFFLIRLKTHGIGMGDVKFSGLIGFFCGFPTVFSAFFIASITGLIFGGVMVLLGRKKTVPIPFAPFLTFGAMCSYLLIRLYPSVFGLIWKQ
ncbi:MAG: A24 family peptidase [Spirochaetaceae bacterium]|jgi:leader peptidase (prepilin peptidase)/N-methyltransferase|nr:A24 family peptidase [Spirochaetaceae bacterium]